MALFLILQILVKYNSQIDLNNKKKREISLFFSSNLKIYTYPLNSLLCVSLA